MDPAAGTVSVGVDTSHLHLGSYFWWSDLEHLADWKILRNRKKDLLGEPWMGFESIGIHPHYTGDRKTFTIGYDLRVESVNLTCSWLAFVVLSLALGVDPYSGGLLDLKRNMSTNFREITLKSSSSKSVIHVRKQENRVLARVIPELDYSLTRGLAWVGWKIETHGKDVHIVLPGLQILASGFQFLDTRNRHATHRLHIHHDMDAWDSQATARALVWVLYVETYYHLPLLPHSMSNLTSSHIARVLPVVQEILKLGKKFLKSSNW